MTLYSTEAKLSLFCTAESFPNVPPFKRELKPIEYWTLAKNLLHAFLRYKEKI